MIMKKSAFMLLIILLSLTANAQTPYRNEDGKKIDKEELETKDYLPEIHGTIRLSLSIRQKWLPVVSKYAMHASALPEMYCPS